MSAIALSGRTAIAHFRRCTFSTDASIRRSMSFVARTKPWRMTAKPPIRTYERVQRFVEREEVFELRCA
jgi:hypothetical protein